MVDIYVETCRDDVELPTYARQGDAGMDIRADMGITIGPGDTVVIPTGLKMAIPAGYEIQVRPRSGMSAKTSLRVANSPGTIDSGYRDEIGIIMWNSSTDDSYEIKKGDRIAQIVLNEVPKINFIPTDNVKLIGEDRGGGFGSTGKE